MLILYGGVFGINSIQNLFFSCLYAVNNKWIIVIIIIILCTLFMEYYGFPGKIGYKVIIIVNILK